MTTRTDIINHLIKRYGYKSYLEIGVQNPNSNFAKTIIEHKTGVDPDIRSVAPYVLIMTSDDYFAQNREKPTPDTYDIIFIDGLHEAQQAYKDIVNAVAILNEGGTIVMHDCNPATEAMTVIPRGDAKEWTGDVWMAFVQYRQSNENYYMFVVNTDYGVGIIRKAKVPAFRVDMPLTYLNLVAYRKVWLNLIEPEDLNHALNKIEKINDMNNNSIKKQKIRIDNVEQIFANNPKAGANMLNKLILHFIEIIRLYEAYQTEAVSIIKTANELIQRLTSPEINIKIGNQFIVNYDDYEFIFPMVIRTAPVDGDADIVQTTTFLDTAEQKQAIIDKTNYFLNKYTYPIPKINAYLGYVLINILNKLR